jgi:hypothetical protein
LAHVPSPVAIRQQTCPDPHAQLSTQFAAGHVWPRTQNGAHAPVLSAAEQHVSSMSHV